MTQAALYGSQADLHRTFAGRAPLTAIESIALECLKQIAGEGRQATQPELCAACGVTYQSGTMPAIVARLERKGYITRKFYQRGQQITITETGISTAAPSCTAPHWRNRTEQAPTPAIQQVRTRDMSLSAMIEQEARRQNKALSDFLAELVYIGWHGLMAEREGG